MRMLIGGKLLRTTAILAISLVLLFLALLFLVWASGHADWAMEAMSPSDRRSFGANALRRACAPDGAERIENDWAEQYLKRVRKEAQPGALSSYIQPDLPALCNEHGSEPLPGLMRGVIFEKGTPEEIRQWMEMSDVSHLSCDNAVHVYSKAIVARIAPVCRAMGFTVPDYGRSCVGRTGREIDLRGPRGVQLFVTLWPPHGRRDELAEDDSDARIDRDQDAENETVPIEGRVDGLNRPERHMILVYALRQSRWRLQSSLNWPRANAPSESGNWQERTLPGDRYAVYLTGRGFKTGEVESEPRSLPQVDGVRMLARLELEGWGCAAEEPS
jgi:hypothetical protein